MFSQRVSFCNSAGHWSTVFTYSFFLSSKPHSRQSFWHRSQISVNNYFISGKIKCILLLWSTPQVPTVDMWISQISAHIPLEKLSHDLNHKSGGSGNQCTPSYRNSYSFTIYPWKMRADCSVIYCLCYSFTCLLSYSYVFYVLICLLFSSLFSFFWTTFLCIDVLC